MGGSVGPSAETWTFLGPVRQTPTVLDVYVIIELTGFAGRIPAI